MTLKKIFDVFKKFHNNFPFHPRSSRSGIIFTKFTLRIKDYFSSIYKVKIHSTKATKYLPNQLESNSFFINATPVSGRLSPSSSIKNPSTIL